MDDYECCFHLLSTIIRPYITSLDADDHFTETSMYDKYLETCDVDQAQLYTTVSSLMLYYSINMDINDLKNKLVLIFNDTHA